MKFLIILIFLYYDYFNVLSYSNNYDNHQIKDNDQNKYTLSYRHSQKWYHQGMSYIKNSNYELGLAYLRGACRTYNQSELYWNDLGVTEMRLQQYYKAKKRFLKSLQINPNYDTAKVNLKELKSYIKDIDDDDVNINFEIKQKHNLQSILEISHDEFKKLNNDLSFIHSIYQHKLNKDIMNVYNETYYRIKQKLRYPFLIRNSFKLLNFDINRINNLFNNDYIIDKYGNSIVDFYPHNMIEESSHPYLLKLKLAYQQLITIPNEVFINVDASESGTLLQWNIDSLGWIDIWEYLSNTEHLKYNNSDKNNSCNNTNNTSDKRYHDKENTLIPELLNDFNWLKKCFIDHPFTNNIDNNGNIISFETNHNTTTTNNNKNNSNDDNNNANTTNTTTNNEANKKKLYEYISNFYLKTHWSMMILGEKDAGMFNHQDTLRTSSWQIQLKGRKRWHLCGSEESIYLYNPGDVNMFQPNYKKYPKVLNASCYDIIINPGDIIYYPHDYWHQTLNLDLINIALSGTIMTLLNYKYIKNELIKECNGLQRTFIYDELLCNQLESCYLLWNQLYNNINKI